MKAGILPVIIFGLCASVGFTACESSSDSESQESISRVASSTLVKSFSIRPNVKVMQHLDSVFFSIDQVKGEIFNADSLPWGTDVRKLTVAYSLGGNGPVEIIMPSLTTGRDTVIDLVNHPNDSINFSSGRVWMRVTSSDGEFERIYNLKVNVHAMNADSLQWDTTVLPMPGTNHVAPTAARAVEAGGKYYLMTRDAVDIRLCRADTPDSRTWQTVASPTLPANVDVASLCASSDALYLLDDAGQLLTSADGGETWTVADGGWSHLYGGFGPDVVGVKGSQWVCYPSDRHGELEADMPVKGTSQMWTFTNEWAVEPQAMLVGGVKADGSYSGLAWGFDGSRWMQFSDQMGTRILPAATGMQLFPYFTYRTGASVFSVTRQSAWIAMGGLMADGKVQPSVYYSLDNGINWRMAPDGMQLPAALSPRVDASVLLCDKSFSVAGSKAVKPVTQWDAPYVYLAGGHNASGLLYNQIWTGVLNRLTFKPLQ